MFAKICRKLPCHFFTLSLCSLSFGLSANLLPGISLTSDSVTITEDFMVGDAISVKNAKLTVEYTIINGVETCSIYGGAMVEIGNNSSDDDSSAADSSKYEGSDENDSA
jgi:hypothetical protein